MSFKTLPSLVLLVVLALSSQGPARGAAEESGVQEAGLAGVIVPLARLSPRPLGRQASLGGMWRFNPAPPADFQKLDAATVKDWAAIQVPAEWVMQGFHVKKDSAAAYWREFEVPSDWAGQRLKLRFDSVYSDCHVWVNGVEVGAHEGGFVPFELDITRAARPGQNIVALAVKSESISDVLASATQYAGHPLGGITRKVTLFAVPPVNIAAQVITTRVDERGTRATLHVRLEVANESGRKVRAAAVNLSLDGVRLDRLELPQLAAGQLIAREVEYQINAPKLWDSEHPNLHTLHTELAIKGVTVEKTSQRLGIRQVEVRGNEIYVNNQPVKLRGVCRHETHPLLGRSLTAELCRNDAQIFRAANANYIRTSHYPPSEEFLDACDELGLFVECEAPLCWVQHMANGIWLTWKYRDPKFFLYVMRVNQENIAANRHHPSVIIWSLANESFWSPQFAEVLRRVNRLDQSRPAAFHDQCWGNFNNGGSSAQIAVYHYPDLGGPARSTASARPVLFGEYCDIPYVPSEIFTDPGMRDLWGVLLSEMVDRIEKSPGCAGGAIWSGIDDEFEVPGGPLEGYGFWGVIDAWRREKPETFLVRKAYTPVRVSTRELPLGPGPLRVAVENRYNFINLREVKIAWRLGGERGTLSADIPAHHPGEITIDPKSERQAGRKLMLNFTDPRGFVCESIELPFESAVVAKTAPTPTAGRLKLQTGPESFTITGDRLSCEIDRRTGRINKAVCGGETILVRGPVLMILPILDGPSLPGDLTAFGPFNPVCTNWEARSVTATNDDQGAVTVKVEGEYTEAAGVYTLRFTPGGGLETQYQFTSKRVVKPRQVGMVYYAARDCDTLSWQRKAPWSAYPADHIGRPVGEVAASPNDATHAIHLNAPPSGSFAADTTALGSADFRSSKANILSAALRKKGGAGVTLASDGTQTARAFVDGNRIGWLIAGKNQMVWVGSGVQELQVGAVLQDTIRMMLVER